MLHLTFFLYENRVLHPHEMPERNLKDTRAGGIIREGN